MTKCKCFMDHSLQVNLPFKCLTNPGSMETSAPFHLHSEPAQSLQTPQYGISTSGQPHCSCAWSWGHPMAGSGDCFGLVCLPHSSRVCWSYPVSLTLTFQNTPGFASCLPVSRCSPGSRDLALMWFQVLETITVTKTGWPRTLWDQHLSHGLSLGVDGCSMSIFLTNFLGIESGKKGK